MAGGEIDGRDRILTYDYLLATVRATLERCSGPSTSRASTSSIQAQLDERKKETRFVSISDVASAAKSVVRRRIRAPGSGGAFNVTTAHGFPAIAGADATILVLGTMPGKASLAAGQYYAHGGNSFWKLIGAILGVEVSSPYDERVSSLVTARIAVWDVLKLCTRESSLDSDIEDPVPNEFAEFFNTHRQIERVCFNGAEAENLYKARVQKRIATSFEYCRLPSTSPANASVQFADKLVAWRVGLRR